MEQQTTTITSNRLVLDGFKYAYGVYRKENGFVAVWECMKCMTEGSTPTVIPGLAAAIETAKKGIKKHHAETHAVEAQ